MKLDMVVGAYVFNPDKVLLILHKKLKLWLPVGGHIDADEYPDDAIKREIKEETNLDVKILNIPALEVEGNAVKVLCTPFHVNVHNVGDHDHCCFYYVCEALNADELKLNPELLDYGWFSEDELEDEKIPADVRKQAKLAFKMFKEIKK